MHDEDKGNPNDWSVKGWSARWRRIGPEWFQFQIIDPKGAERTSWVDYKNPFFSNMKNEIKYQIQYFASVDAKKIAEVYTLTFD